MAIYHYKPGSLIDETQVLTNDSGGRRAYLFARPDATTEQLEQIKAGINRLGWKTLATVHEGRPALEVRGFKKTSVMEDALRSNGWVKEPPSVEETDNDRRTSKEKLSNGTLKASGISYIIGDIAFMKYAFSKFNHPTQQESMSRFFNKMDIVAGLGYGLGSLSLLVFGSRDQSQNTIESTARKVRNFARKENIAVADNSALDAAAFTDRSFFGKIRHTLAKYPSETLNAIYVGVGSLLGMAAAYRAVKYHQTGDMGHFKDELWDIGLGAVTASSALAGLVIKEKKPEEGKEKPTGILGKSWAWVQEKPLRATGLGFMVATLLHAKGTYNKWKDKDVLTRNNAIPRGIFVGTNLLSEALLMLSSKGHGTGVKPDGSVDLTIGSATADIIARQPAEKHDTLIQQFAGYLAAPDVLGGRAEDHATMLRNQLAGLKNNPWASHLAKPTTVAAVDAPQAVAAPVVAATPGNTVESVKHAALLQAPAQQAMAHS